MIFSFFVNCSCSPLSTGNRLESRFLSCRLAPPSLWLFTVKWIKALTAGNKLWYVYHTKTGVDFLVLWQTGTLFAARLSYSNVEIIVWRFLLQWNRERKKRMNNTFMKEKPILPLLASMAMPMVLSMLVNSLYNIVDSFFFVAKISEQAMTALSRKALAGSHPLSWLCTGRLAEIFKK